MNMNIKIQNIFYIAKVSKYLQPSSCIQQKQNQKPFFVCFLYFSKIWWVLKMKV
jgi:hypothetical protein